MAIAISPGRPRELSATGAAGRFWAGTRSAARSRRTSRDDTVASNSRPSQNSTLAWFPRTTCAFVTTTPSLDHTTPEPPPCDPLRTTTVERRSFSATSPIPLMDTLLSSRRPLAYHDGSVRARAAAKKFRGQLFPDAGERQMGLHILEPCHWPAVERQ